jgi:anaerobic selenocysteine-containing dehydrogenase
MMDSQKNGAVEKIATSCSLNCWDNCGLKVTIKDGRVHRVEGDSEHPITKGKICGRGKMLEHRTNSNQRLLYPLKKVNGNFERVSWQQVLQEIAVKLRVLKEEDKTTAVLHSHDYANNGLLKSLDQRFFNCYGGVTELTGSLCWGAGIEAQLCDFGNSQSHLPEDIVNSKSVIIWGRNVARTNMHLFQRLKEIKRKGTQIIVIDPIYNSTAKLADHYISVKPGMDSFVALAVMKEMIDQRLEDRPFIEQHSIGFNDVEKLLSYLSTEELIEQAEITKNDLRILVNAYTSRPASTFIGLGMQRYTNGGNTIRTIDALVAMSGNVGIPGGGANFGNIAIGQSFNKEELTLPYRKTKTRVFSRMKQAESMLEANEPPIEMIFVTCGNPMSQVPDTNIVKKAFESVDMKVVIDQFMADTAQLADYVLPCTTVFEEEDIYYSSMYHHYANYGPQVVTPPGEVRTHQWIWTELAKRLGFGDDFSHTTEEFLEMGLKDLQDQGITLQRLKDEKHLPLPVKEVPWDDFSFHTPSGKYEFTSQRAKAQGFDGRLHVDYPMESIQNNYELAMKYPYTLLSNHPARSNHSQHYHLVDQIQEVIVHVSKDIAEKQTLKNGDAVRVFNDRGNISGNVRVMEKAHDNTINIDEGGWSQFGGTVNQLTSSRESDNRNGSTLYDCLVSLEKLY